jgi:hypothetical protein
MNDLTKFCQSIEQEAYKENLEKANCKAIKFDDDNGFVKSLTTDYAKKCRVDFFEIIENGLIMIEMKHIKWKIQDLLDKSETKENIKQKVLSNIACKFTDSLEIIQREIDSNLIPVRNYLVISNDTEINILDRYLPENLRKKPFVICETNKICEKLSILNTRLCQD